jgi:CTP:phosphocholine cytidylyltransferase-like protein
MKTLKELNNKYGLWIIFSSKYEKYKNIITQMYLFKEVINSLGDIDLFYEFVDKIRNNLFKNPLQFIYFSIDSQ